MRTRHFLAGAVAGVTAMAFIGGCAQQLKQLEPKLELRAAAQHLAEAKQAGFTVKLTGNVDDLFTALKPEVGEDTAALRRMLNSSFTVAYDQAGDGVDDDRMLMSATVDGVTGTEIRVVDKTLYAKAPVTELATKFGLDDIGELRTEATAETPSLGAFFDGKWVSLDLKAATDLTGEGLTGRPGGDLDTAKTMAEIRTSASNLFEGASIVRDPADAKHLIITSSTTKAYAEMKRLVTAVSGTDSGEITDFGDAPKDRPIVLDLWIDDKKLTALEVNILQFIDGAAGRVAVRFEVTTGAGISAPDGATKIDTAALADLGTGGGIATAPEGSATQMADMLGFQAMDLAGEDDSKPADHLKEAMKELVGSGATAKIVRRGVAEVTSQGGKACVKLPATAAGDPVVTKGAC